MERFIFTNLKGNRISIGTPQDDFLLSTHSGTTSAEVLVTSRRGYSQNGQFYVKTNLGTRIITLEFYSERRGDLSFYETKRKLSSVLNPMLGEGILIYENDFIRKQIPVVVTGMPDLTEKNQILGKYTVEFTAHNPFWQDVSENALKMGGFLGGLTYPLSFTGSGRTFAQKGMICEIDSYGDYDAPVRAEFIGECTNPVLTLGDEKIHIITDIFPGEKITVNTAYGNKNITKTDENGYETNINYLITDDTTFFSLKPGSNHFTFSADLGEPEVYIYWRNRYTGV